MISGVNIHVKVLICVGKMMGFSASCPGDAIRWISWKSWFIIAYIKQIIPQMETWGIPVMSFTVNFGHIRVLNFLCVCVCMCVCVCVYAVSRIQFFVIPLNVACQSPLSREFSRQEYWSGLPFPSPGNFPDPGVGIRGRTQVSCIAGRYFAIRATREALNSP